MLLLLSSYHTAGNLTIKHCICLIFLLFSLTLVQFSLFLFALEIIFSLNVEFLLTSFSASLWEGKGKKEFQDDFCVCTFFLRNQEETMSVLCGLFLFSLFRLTNGVGCCDLFFLNFTTRFVIFLLNFLLQWRAVCDLYLCLNFRTLLVGEREINHESALFLSLFPSIVLYCNIVRAIDKFSERILYIYLFPSLSLALMLAISALW